MCSFFLEHAHDYAMMVIDGEGRIVSWSPGAAHVFGRDAGIIGQPFVDCFAPEERDAGLEQGMRSASEQGNAAMEHWYVRQDGSRFWGSGILYSLGETQQTGYLNIVRDLTAQKRRELELADARVRLEASLNVGDIGTWAWDIAADRVFADSNMARFFGVSPENANGGPIAAYIRAIHPEDRERVETIIATTIQNRGRYEAEYRLITADGSLLWVSARGGIECDAQGNPISLPGVVMDITRRRAAEEARMQAQLQAEKDRRLLNTVLEALPAGVIIADPVGKIVHVNAACERLWGGRVGAPSVEGYAEYVGYWHATGKRIEAHEWAMSRALQGELCEGDLIEIEKLDGSGRVVIVNSAAPVYDAENAIIGGIVAELDVTAQVRAEEALQRQQVEIKALNMRLQRAMQETHHRVKNNLQLISALIEIQADNLGEAAIAQRLKLHVSALATIHDLLTQQAKEEINTSVVSTREVLSRLIAILQSTSGDREIKAEIADIPLPVQKATSLSLLVSECVSNAIKHARGEVEVTLQVENGIVRLEVCDDGPGFPPDFDPLQAANTGLELIDSTARWDLRGEVRYTNQEKGGARVVVTFPTSALNSDP